VGGKMGRRSLIEVNN
jgi:hypothetical protein